MFHCLDFCMLCGAYDTVQTYFKVGEKDKCSIFIHVCEKCAHTYSEKEIARRYNKGRD